MKSAIATADQAAGWELVHDVAFERVRRIRVVGGWLYQVELQNYEEPTAAVPGASISGWHAPVFVPDGGRP